MTRSLGKSLLSFLAIALLGFGCTVKTYENGGEIVPPTTYLFAEDFSESELEEQPEGWPGQNLANAVFEVVKDPLGGPGRAIRIAAEGDRRDVGFYGPKWDVPPAGVKTIAIEFDILHVEGTNNLYMVVGGRAASIHFRVEEGKLVRGYDVIGDLGDKWNTVRLFANYEKDEIAVYLNDMESPALGPVPFRYVPESWADSRVHFMHAVFPDAPIDSYYTNFKVWAVH